MIECAKESDRKLLIEKALESDYIEVQNGAASIISRAEESEQPILREKVKKIVEKALKSNDIEVQKKAIEMIEYAKESDRKSLIEKVLGSDNVEIQIAAVERIRYAQKSDQLILKEKVKEIIEKILDGDDIEVQNKAVWMIQYVRESEQPILKEKVKEIVEKALDGDDVKVQKKAVWMIYYTRQSDWKSLIEKALSNDNVEVQRGAAEMIPYVPESEQESLVHLITSKEASNFFVESSLYKRRDIGNIYLERQKVEKIDPGSDSELTLIGGILKEKSIIRHIKPEAFLAWQKTYEDYEGWRKAGFDYVPIEPIQSYFFDKKKKLVNVFSGVLDLSLASWNSKSSLFKEELIEQQEKIIETLEKQKVEHNDIHDDNFVLCFFRKQDGSVDFDKVPRLYAIDFNEAFSS